MPFASAETASLKSSVPSTRPPSYSRHFHDELLSPPALRSSGSFALRSSRPRSTNQFHLAQMLQILTSNDPLVLTMDNTLLYPPPPSNALYHLPRVLTWSGNEIFLFRSLPVAGTRRNPAVTRDLALYTMRRIPFKHEIVLLPRREGLKGAVMRGKRSMLGSMTWDIQAKGKTVLRYAKGKWTDPSGRIIALEKQRTAEDMREEGIFASLREEITIQGSGVEVWMKDLIVAAWCSKIWQSNAASFSRTIKRGQANIKAIILPTVFRTHYWKNFDIRQTPWLYRRRILRP